MPAMPESAAAFSALSRLRLQIATTSQPSERKPGTCTCAPNPTPMIPTLCFDDGKIGSVGLTYLAGSIPSHAADQQQSEEQAAEKHRHAQDRGHYERKPALAVGLERMAAEHDHRQPRQQREPQHEIDRGDRAVLDADGEERQRGQRGDDVDAPQYAKQHARSPRSSSCFFGISRPTTRSATLASVGESNRGVRAVAKRLVVRRAAAAKRHAIAYF